MARVRRNVNDLTEDEINLLEKAFQGIIARDEADDLSQPIDEAHPERISYFRLASFHGYMTYHCYHHGNNAFFHWHRKYVALFEAALRSVEGCENVTIPYLDTTAATDSVDFPDWLWTRPTFASYTVPSRYLSVDANFHVSSGGKEKHFLDYETLCKEYSPIVISPNGQTTRDSKTNLISFIKTHPENFYLKVDYATKNFPFISSNFNDIHGIGHDAIGGAEGETGGNMTCVPLAAFDPIFWFHHSNVERWLWIWENRHNLNSSTDYENEEVFPAIEGRDEVLHERFENYFEVGNGLTDVLKQHGYDFQGFTGSVKEVLDNPQLYKIPYETSDNVTPSGAMRAFSLGAVEHGPITVGTQYSILVKNIDRSQIDGSFYVILTVNGKELKNYIFQIGPTCVSCKKRPFISTLFLVHEAPVSVSLRAVDRRGNELNVGSPKLNIRLPLHVEDGNIVNA